jgi:ABC-2 type transport system ATP-binding protein
MTMSCPSLAIEALGLTKSFGATRAVAGIDLAVPTGAIYGLLGPNGAGKTTAIRIFATLLRPDAGSARVFGHDVLHEAGTVRGRIGLTGQFASTDEDLTAQENLVLLGRLLGHTRARAKARAAQLLGAFGLSEAAGRQVKHLSGGMRRRLDVAASIVVVPDLLFLDEPTTGLDPHSRSQVWEIIRTVVAGGKTVLLTTQYLDEADQLADRIAVMDHGKIIAEGTSGQLKASVGSSVLQVRLQDPQRVPEAERVLARTLSGVVRLKSDPAALSARITAPASARDGNERAADALAQLARRGITVAGFALGQPSLDEVFLTLTGHDAHGDVSTGEDAA